MEISISQPAAEEQLNHIYIAGAVNNPGFYWLKAGDSIDALIRAAGGTLPNADLDRINLYIPYSGEVEERQKVDLNRAEAWLLQALPGIGKVRAEAIIAYRQQHGPFQNINELTKVEGIGVTIYQQIKDLVTVAD